MKEIAKFLNMVSGVGGMAFVGILTVLIFVSVVMRYVFNVAVFFTDEISTYLIMAIGFTGLAYTMKQDGHIQVDVVISHLPGKWRRGTLAIDFAFLILYSFIQLAGSVMLALSFYRAGTSAVSVLETPLFSPALIMIIGSGMFLIEVINQIVSKKE